METNNNKQENSSFVARKPSAQDGNMSQAVAFAMKHVEDVMAFRVYLYLAQRTVGYCQATSDHTSIAMIQKAVHFKSNKTVVNRIQYLIDNNFIKKISTNKVANIGKVAYKYQLVFDRKIYADAPHYDLYREGSTHESSADDATISYEPYTCFYRYTMADDDLSHITALPSTEEHFNTFIKQEGKVLVSESYYTGIYTNLKSEAKKNYDKSIKNTLDARKHRNKYALKAYKLLNEQNTQTKG